MEVEDGLSPGGLAQGVGGGAHHRIVVRITFSLSQPMHLPTHTRLRARTHTHTHVRTPRNNMDRKRHSCTTVHSPLPPHPSLREPCARSMPGLTLQLAFPSLSHPLSLLTPRPAPPRSRDLAQVGGWNFAEGTNFSSDPASSQKGCFCDHVRRPIHLCHGMPTTHLNVPAQAML